MSDDEAWIAELWLEVRPAAAVKVAALTDALGTGGDAATAARLAHSLAGSLGSYRHLDASLAAAEIERLLLEDASGVSVETAAPLLERIRRAVT